MNRLKREAGTAIVLITHNLGVVAEVAQRVSVMYAGVIVEEADVRTLFARPKHPYTVGLLNSIPRPDRTRGRGRRTRLQAIAGTVPSLFDLKPGCRFADRCPHAFEPCRIEEPPLAPPNNPDAAGQTVRCWLHTPPADTVGRAA
jgi:oligopeptide/dipeptide ABC transporter ATP-binding protein